LNSTLHYLSNEKLVKDEDLILIVDGQQSWFQLPSDVIVAQYKMLLEDANIRLLKKYGANKEGFQKFNQTIVFGADKMCESDDMACKYVPQSVFPDNLYGAEAGRRISEMPAKFINSKMVMGPASDLRMLYRAAQRKFDEGRTQSQTIQSVLATLYGEQQLKRDEVEVGTKHARAKIKGFFTGGRSISLAERRLAHANIKLLNDTQHEFSIGLDYTHTLFQPLVYCTEDELVPLVHDNSTNPTEDSHAASRPQHLSLPPVLDKTKPPFWRPDFVKHNPSPNQKSAYIDKLEITMGLDALPNRKTPWRKIPLIQNTYTGAIPAVLSSPHNLGGEHRPTADISWNSLWYSKYRRALLRNYFRTQQSPDGYHNSLVGGDRYWDTRGGRGGVWTEAEQMWLPWGEVDGVCGRLSQMKEVFQDDKGVWLHEQEDTAENERILEEQVFDTMEEDEKKKAEELLQRLQEAKRKKNEQEAKERQKEEKESTEGGGEEQVKRRRKSWNV
jgi:hypothetical protein